MAFYLYRLLMQPWEAHMTSVLAETPEKSPNGSVWVRLVFAILGKGGITGLIAVGLSAALVYMFWQQNKVVQVKLEAIHTEILTAKVAMNSFKDSQNAWNDKREDLLEKQLRLMRLQCVMQSESKTQMQKCLE